MAHKPQPKIHSRGRQLLLLPYTNGDADADGYASVFVFAAFDGDPFADSDADEGFPHNIMTERIIKNNWQYYSKKYDLATGKIKIFCLFPNNNIVKRVADNINNSPQQNYDWKYNIVGEY